MAVRSADARCSFSWHELLQALRGEPTRSFDLTPRLLTLLAAPSVVGPDVVTDIAAELGISRNAAVVAYDDVGGLNAARFWWVMNLYGKSHVRVLRKGWYGAVSDGFSVSIAPDVGAAKFAQGLAAEDPFVAREQEGWRATLQDVAEASAGGAGAAAQLLDVRSHGEWDGSDLRGNPRGGHLPGSLHLPHSKLTNGFFCEEDAKTRELAKWAQLDLSRPIVTYCQSGMRAAHTAMMLRAAGAENTVVFDESMFAVMRDEEVPLETGRSGSRMGEL